MIHKEIVQRAAAVKGEPGSPLTEDEDAWIERHLHVWSRWIRTGHFTAGYPHHSTVLLGYTHSDLDASYERLDRYIAEIVDVCLGELPPAERAAVHNHFRLTVSRFPRRTEEQAYERAKMLLIPLLRGHNVV